MAMPERVKVILEQAPPGAIPAGSLPVGSTVIDRDGDTWYHGDQGWFSVGGIEEPGSTYPPVAFGPYEVTYNPTTG